MPCKGDNLQLQHMCTALLALHSGGCRTTLASYHQGVWRPVRTPSLSMAQRIWRQGRMSTGRWVGLGPLVIVAVPLFYRNQWHLKRMWMQGGECSGTKENQQLALRRSWQGM